MRLSLRLALLVLVGLVIGSVYSFRNTSSAQRIKPSLELPPSCIAAPPGMVAWWPGEGDGKDIRGENDGTLQGGVTFPAGEVEHAFGTAGGDVNVPYSQSLDPPSGRITVDAWVNPASYQSTASIINKRTVANNTGYTLEYLFNGNGTILWHVYVGGTAVQVLSNAPLPLNTWTHVAGTYDGTTSALYFNGTMVGSTAFSGTIDPSPNADLQIGRNIVLNAFWDGLIDEVEVFDRALDSQAIQDIVTAGTLGKCRPRCVTLPQHLTPDDSMVGWWTGDDNPYDIWNQNHGTFESPSPTPSPSASPYANGKVGRAFNFDGSGSYVDLGNTYSGLDLTDAITIDAWVRPTGIPPGGPPALPKQNGKANPNVLGSGFEAILTKWHSPQSQVNSAKPEQTGDSYGLWLTSVPPQTGKPAGATPSTPVQTSLTLYAAVETGECGSTSLFGGTIPLNVWSHVAMTYDSTTGTLALYVNGVRVVWQSCETNDPIIQTATQVNIGCQTCGLTQQPVDPFQGQIDEVEVFAGALDQSQIQNINNGAAAGKCKPCYAFDSSGLLGWWNGDANSNDTSGSGYNGTWEGAAAYAFGKVGQSFSFNGTDAAVVAPSSSVSVMNQVPLTVDAWVRPALRTDGTAADFYPNNAVSNDTPGSSGHGFGVNVFSDGSNMTVEYQDDFRIIPDVSFNADQWYHIAIVYTDGNVKTYVDGLLVDDFDYGQGEFDSTSPVSIGKHNDDVSYGTRRFFKGLIDEVEIFSRELSEAEIQSIVAAGASGKCKSIDHFAERAQKSRAGTAKTSQVHPNFNQTDQVGDATVTLVDLNSQGTTDYQTLPTYQQGPMPFGYGDPLEIADISTFSSFNGDATICFTLLSISDSEEQLFNHLRILHLEGNILVDRTSSHYFPLRYLCATVPAGVGFSPFVISQNQNLAPSAADGNIGGTITDASGAPVSGVTINLSGTQSRETITDASGHYGFDSVETNGFYTVTPSRANYTFSPANQSFSVLGVHTEASFTATANNGGHLNPLDAAEFFVRQHYLDFLGREPDAPGLAGWVSTLSNCAAGDASCDRVHVSEAFYRSQEFQERGYFAYRFYSTALGRKPDYAEFAPDLGRVSGFLDNAQLEAAKTAFIDDFMARPAFAGAYDSLSDTAFVDKLIQTSGVDLSRRRQELIDSLRTRRLRRADVLRQITESAEVYQKYYNQAFVVMEYFGYLHRDPDALYTDWIRALDANPADSRRMVEGFVNSAEYRNRFAP